MQPVKKYFMWLEENYAERKDTLLKENTAAIEADKPAWRIYLDSVLKETLSGKREDK
ncbi:MAG: hypothetical protein UC961_05315 [Emergencia sp.]|nr:hypothetical protein [Emergencia sp.]